MNGVCIKPPDCCVIVEMEPGARLGYRKALLLSEIKTLGSLRLAAKTTCVPQSHAIDLVQQMNNDFSRPLVAFAGQKGDEDSVRLTDFGDKVVGEYWPLFEPVWLNVMEERSRSY